MRRSVMGSSPYHLATVVDDARMKVTGRTSWSRFGWFYLLPNCP